MQVTITLNEAQLDKLLYLVMEEIYQIENIKWFYDEGQTDEAEFLEEICRDEKRLFDSMLKQIIDYRKQRRELK